MMSHTIQSEITVLYGLVLLKSNVLNTDHPIDLNLRRTDDPKYCNIELNGNSLLFSFEPLSASPFLRISILKSRLNTAIQYIDKNKIPQIKYIDEVTFLQNEYSFVNHNNLGAGWTEAPAHIKFSTSRQLIEDWFERFLEEAINNPAI